MDILALGAKLLSEQLGVSIDPQTMQSALSQLLGDGQGNLDLAGLAGKMASSGELSSVVSSWLGDGGNAGISAEGIMSLLGDAKVSEFAGAVGTDTSNAASGLAEVLPQLMDNASSGGNLLEAAGGLDGLMGAAKSFLS